MLEDASIKVSSVSSIASSVTTVSVRAMLAALIAGEADRSRHGSKWITSALVEAAASAARSKNTYLSAQQARIASRRGAKRAQIGAAHSILVSAYYMLTRDEPYYDLGPEWSRGTSRPRPDVWPPSSNVLATPSSSSQPPDFQTRLFLERHLLWVTYALLGLFTGL
ncbi:hypothetical protein ABH924_001727 [Arthrobacter sp. GAS37]